MTECLHVKCARLHRMVTAKFNQGLRPFRITIQQFVILKHIAEYPDCTPCAVHIGKAYHIEKSTLSRNLKRLVSSNLISMDPPAGRRGRGLHITDSGRAVLAQATPAWQATNTHLLAMVRSQTGSLLSVIGDAEDALLRAIA
ncbi:MarR family transcriptional regulator [bacterium]|nr:MarR family transcriptional regulator [bacterium]